MSSNGKIKAETEKHFQEYAIKYYSADVYTQSEWTPEKQQLYITELLGYEHIIDPILASVGITVSNFLYELYNCKEWPDVRSRDFAVKRIRYKKIMAKKMIKSMKRSIANLNCKLQEQDFNNTDKTKYLSDLIESEKILLDQRAKLNYYRLVLICMHIV